MSEQHLRMSDAEREQAASALGEHYAQGRLTADEHGERLDLIWAARTRGELAPVFRDLPGHATAYAENRPRPTARGRSSWSRGRLSPFRHGVPLPVLVVLAILLVLTVLTHLPLVVLGLLAWFFVTRCTRSRRNPHGYR